MGRQRQTDRHQLRSLEFPLALYSLAWSLPGFWFDTGLRQAEKCEVRLSLCKCIQSVLLITSGMWQRRKDILTMISCTLTIKIPCPLCYRPGYIFDHENRWETIYSHTLRAGICNERAIALHVPSRDCRAVAECSALRLALRASKGEKDLHPACSCWTSCRVTSATETSVSVIISHYRERQPGVKNKELPQSHFVSERHLGAFGKFTLTTCLTSTA